MGFLGEGKDGINRGIQRKRYSGYKVGVRDKEKEEREREKREQKKKREKEG